MGEQKLALKMVTGGIVRTNAYLLCDRQAGVAAIIDAPDNTTPPLLNAAEKLGVRGIALILTHGHFDHIADHAVVTMRWPDARVLMHEAAEPMLMDPHAIPFDLPFKIPPRKADAYLRDGQEIQIGTLRGQVILTPGHAPGHIAIYFPEESLLFGGDLIIGGAIGRTDLPGADEAAMVDSIRRIMALPRETKLLSGHGPASTLHQEMERNPYVQAAVEHGRLG